MVFNKKAISPVVATALLLVVAVVAVVGFQTWFQTYQSGINTKVEQQSNAGSAVSIERLENGTVYLKNGGVDVLTADITVGGSSNCGNTSQTLNGSKVTSVAIGNGCDLKVGTAYDVVVVTGNGVFSETELAR